MLETSEVQEIEANPEPVKMGAAEVQEKPLYEEKSMDEWQNALLKVLEEPQSPDSLEGGVCDVKMEKDTESFNISDDIFGSSIEFEECEKMPISEEDSGSSSSGSGSGDEIKKEQDYSSTESNRESDSFCAGLNIDIDKMELDSGFENLDMDFDFSDLDIDPTILSDNRGNESFDLSNFCMDELQEKDLAEEEALLLAVVSKAEIQEQQIQELNNSCNSTTTTNDFSSCNSTTTTNVDEFSSGQKKSRKGDSQKSSRSPPPGKRKVKVDWTPDLHRRFVQAVEQLGVDKAVPSRILELMGVTCLTRHNIASHLQKYRSHRKHLLAREAEAATWNQRRQLYTIPGAGRRGLIGGSHNSSGRSPVIHPRPAIGYPSVPQQAPPPPPQVAYRAPLHVWGHPTVDNSMFHMWHKPGFIPRWPPQPLTPQTAPAPGSHLYPHPPLSSPMVPVPGCIPPPYSLANTNSHPPKEEVDAAISEVLKNPWTPLPIGLNPPSLEGVMTELQRQGVPSLPPASATS